MLQSLMNELNIVTITGILCLIFCLWIIVQYAKKIFVSGRLSKIMLFGLVSVPALMIIFPVTIFLQDKLQQNGLEGNLYIGAFGIVAFSYVLFAGLVIRVVGKRLP